MRVLILTRADLIPGDAPKDVTNVRWTHIAHRVKDVALADTVAVYDNDDKVKVLKSRYSIFDKSPTMSYFDFCRYLRDEARKACGL